jgi:hypothetical protein
MSWTQLPDDAWQFTVNMKSEKYNPEAPRGQNLLISSIQLGGCCSYMQFTIYFSMFRERDVIIEFMNIADGFVVKGGLVFFVCHRTLESLQSSY